MGHVLKVKHAAVTHPEGRNFIFSANKPLTPTLRAVQVGENTGEQFQKEIFNSRPVFYAVKQLRKATCSIAFWEDPPRSPREAKGGKPQTNVGKTNVTRGHYSPFRHWVWPEI
jgi:hypothetical protein